MKNYPVLIAIVGADGAGKSTVSKELVRRLNELGHSTCKIDRWDIVDNPHYPSARFLKSDIPDIRKCVAGMPDTARFLFLLWSMNIALSGNMRDYGQDDFMILDGYWMKHAASEIAYGLDANWVISVACKLPKAQIIVYLRQKPENAWLRKQGDVVPYECGMDELCSEKSFLKHQKLINNLLDKWSGADGWIEIDASQPLVDVVDEAVEKIIFRFRRTLP